MNIPIVLGKGEGQTLLSAFDAALKDCGVHNYNLIYLSSIIPPDSHVIQTDQFQAPAEQYGYKAYVIKAEERSNSIGTAIGAGLGWYQFEDGRGVFVEHHVQANDEKRAGEILQSSITKSIQDLCAFREIPFQQDKAHSAVSITTVQNKPTCVLALTIYHTEAWPNAT
jgi:arginine decarboxylase